VAIGTTIDRTPPPFFRQGPSALTKVTLFSALAILLMAADTRFKLTNPLRAGLAIVLHYPERALLVPVQAWQTVSDYALGLQHAQMEEGDAKRTLAKQSERASRVEQLEAENAQLRALLELRPRLTVKSHSAQVLYEASDIYSRKVVIDRGATDGIVLGAPVINEAGVLGQVTRVYPLSSEVTLLVDKDAAIPVLNTRTQARGAAFGSAVLPGGGMELRFMAGNADVQVGDVLTTSGVDGVYPPGLQVAKVALVDRKLEAGFARIVLTPASPPDGVRDVLVLEPVGLQLPPKPVDPPPEDAPKGATPKKGGGKK
jgi:rod shape-determining protein MreC